MQPYSADIEQQMQRLYQSLNERDRRRYAAIEFTFLSRLYLMGARLRIFLNPEEDRTLFELRTAQAVPQRTKDRAEALRLNARGWYVDKIAAHFNWAEPNRARGDSSVDHSRVRRTVGCPGSRQ